MSNGYNGNGTSGSEVTMSTTLIGRSSGGDFWGLGVPWAADLNYTGNVYNIQDDPRLNQHADGTGTSSGDRDAINAAIYAANAAGGGIVYLPAGTYNLYFSNSCGFTLLPRVSVMGAGASNTFVNYGYGPAPTPDQGGYAACFGSTQGGISDITFTNVNQSGKWPQSALAGSGNEVFLQRTNWNIGTAQWIVLANATNFTVQNSSIVQGLDPSYNGPICLAGATNFVLRGNTIKYVAGALVFDQTTNGVFENNTITRDASQSPPASVITHVIVGNFANNFMLLGNTFDVSGGTLPVTNTGETIGSESGGVTRYDEFRGTVQSASSNSITDGSQNFNYSTNNAIPNLRVGATLAIVSGTGSGQWATVTGISSNGQTVTVDTPWAVLPDTTSNYATFDWGAANWIIAGNNMSNNEKGIEFWDASIRDILIAGNTMTNNSEILLSPTEQPVGAGLFNLIVNTQILNNTVTDNNNLRPAAISAVPREDWQINTFGTQIIGLELRGNSITGTVPNTLISNTSLDDSKALTEGINLYWQWQTIANFEDTGIPSILGTVIQGNTLTNSKVGVEIGTGVYQTALASNSTNNVAAMLGDVTLPGANHPSTGTVTAGAPTAKLVSIPAVSTGEHAQLSVFFQTGVWTTAQVPSATTSSISFGSGAYKPIVGDYDGDGLLDCAVYSSGTFLVRPSSNPNVTIPVYLGNPGDLAMPGDYDGDGKTDIAIFRPSTGQWFYYPSSKPGNPIVAVESQAGSADIPLLGDYDGDGKTDYSFYRTSTRTFYQMLSTNLGVTHSFTFGNIGDLPVPGDYDGDGKTDIALFRPSTGTWYFIASSTGGVQSQASSAQPGDIPVPGDYDADGKTDFAVWRASTQSWYVILSGNPFVTVTVAMGANSGNLANPLSLTPNGTAVKASLTVN